MRRIWRLGLLAVVAAAAFAVAIGRFSEAAVKGCAQRVRQDPSYQVRLVEQPRTDLATYRLAVTRSGRPVTGATVCLNSYMLGMSAMATTDTGREVAPGVYEMSLTFQMGGRWGGQVLIAQRGEPLVAVPLAMQVPLPTTTTSPASTSASTSSSTAP